MRFMTIHFSNNWMNDPSIEYYDSLSKAETAVRAFRGGAKYHSHDKVYIVEIKLEGVSEDLNEDGTGPILSGFKTLV